MHEASRLPRILCCVCILTKYSHNSDVMSMFFVLGNVVTIKLSENQENVMQNDGTYATMIVETHFQVKTYFFLSF